MPATWEQVLVYGCLAALFYFTVRIALGIRDAFDFLGETAVKTIVAIGDDIKKRKDAEQKFYEKPWTIDEAREMLHELRSQLDERLLMPVKPELRFLPPEASNLLLGAAVISRFALSTPEIRSRIALLESVIERQASQPVAAACDA
jgi:hypothetical protein